MPYLVAEPLLPVGKGGLRYLGGRLFYPSSCDFSASMVQKDWKAERGWVKPTRQLAIGPDFVRRA